MFLKDQSFNVYLKGEFQTICLNEKNVSKRLYNLLLKDGEGIHGFDVYHLASRFITSTYDKKFWGSLFQSV